MYRYINIIYLDQVCLLEEQLKIKYSGATFNGVYTLLYNYSLPTMQYLQ